MPEVTAPGILRCPSCGAPAAPDSRACAYCAAALALVACPSCFASIFQGAEHCSSCGAATTREPAEPRPPRPCPECRREMAAVRVGAVTVDECGSCGGLFVDRPSFERVCAEREQQAVVLAAESAAAPPRTARADRYWPCPICTRLMNRQNFARLSGVIVDVCKRDGVWFNHGELKAIVEFIRAGGLERARRREKADLQEERQRLRQQQLAQAVRERSGGGSGDPDRALDYGAVLAAISLTFD
jgi:Zn-finger nucleic acid-binding protein